MSLVSTPTWRPQVPASCWRRGRARATPRSLPGADKLLASLPQGPCVAVASARRLRAAVDSVVAVVRRATRRWRRAATGGRLPGYRGGSGGRGHGDQPGDGGAAFAGPARHTPRAVLVALADMPWIRHASMAGVLDALQHAPMAAPSHRGQRGHPVGFRADLLPRLALLSADEARGDCSDNRVCAWSRWRIQACCSISTRPPTWTGQAERRPPARPPWRPFFRLRFPYLSVR